MRSPRPFNLYPDWQWPEGDTHFPQDWRGYQKTARDRFQYWVETTVIENDEPPYMPPSKHGILLDIGAHVGTWAVDLAGRYSWVLAWEPLHWDLLAKNAHAQGVTNITVTPHPVSDHPRRDKIYKRIDNSGDSGLNLEDTVARQVLDCEVSTVDISIQSLKTFCVLKDIPWWITGIKIDVQGHEYQVLKGAEATIREHWPVICAEFTDGNQPAEQLLKSWGYHLEERVKKDWIWRKT